MDGDTLLFFNKAPQALPLYLAFCSRVLSMLPQTEILVQKTQITFRRRRGFAFISLPRGRGRGIVVTFGLARRVDDPRILQAVEPYPGRWTHHVLVEREEQLDGVLLDWIREAAVFAMAKGRGGS